MDTNAQRCDAVLNFNKRRVFDGELLVRLAEKTLCSKGFESFATDVTDVTEVTISTDLFVFSIKCDASSDMMMGRLMIAVTEIVPSMDADTPLMVLAEMCRKAILATEADQIVWLRTDVVFSA